MLGREFEHPLKGGLQRLLVLWRSLADLGAQHPHDDRQVVANPEAQLLQEPVGVVQGRPQAGALFKLGYVAADLARPDDRAVLITDRRDCERDLDDTAVLALAVV